MIRVTRRYRFPASHRLHSERLSDLQNQAAFGKCNNPFGHGHDYVLDITVYGPVDGSTGQAVHAPTLDRLVHEAVLQDISSKNLNRDVAEFRDTVPTSENVAGFVAARLRSAWKSAFPDSWPILERIRLQETKNNTFEVFL